MELDTPKHKAQLQKIKARWDALRVYENKEYAGIHGDIETFVFQDDVSAELGAMEKDINKVLIKMMDTQRKLGLQFNKQSYNFERRLDNIVRKLEVLDRKWKQNVQFDPETRMWKLSMDNKVSDELKMDNAEIQKYVQKFVDSNQKVEAEVKDLGDDLMENFQEISAEIEESAKMLEDPKYKAELEAIANKMKALDMKVKKNLKIEQ